MKQLKHTPGLWRLHDGNTIPPAPEGGYADGCSVDGPDGYPLEKGGYLYEEDARLIAAAPEMLELLINMCADMQQYGNYWGSAERLIEKATGYTLDEILESDQ